MSAPAAGCLSRRARPCSGANGWLCSLSGSLTPCARPCSPSPPLIPALPCRYAATKAAAENIVKSYYRSFKLPVIITRGNNVFGPHQYPEKLIPKFVRRLLKGLPCCIHGDGSNCRHFIFVEDVARAFITILHKGGIGETYNIGCEAEYTNLEVAEKLVKALKPTCKDPKEHIEFVPDRPFNDVRYYISSDKLLALGWKEEVTFEEALQKTIAWYSQVSPDWWDVGTDSALAAHPTAALPGVTKGAMAPPDSTGVQ